MSPIVPVSGIWMWSPGPRPRPMANTRERERKSGGRVVTASHPNPVDCWALCMGEGCFYLFGRIQGNQRHKPQCTKVDSSSSVPWDLISTLSVTAVSWETGPKWLLLNGVLHVVGKEALPGCSLCSFFLLGLQPSPPACSMFPCMVWVRRVG